MNKQNITVLDDFEMQGITGGTAPVINVNISPKIVLKFTNNINLAFLVLVNDTINKPISINQHI